MKDKNRKPFFCYSKKLRDELAEAGFRYVTVGRHDKSNNLYWLYMPTDELNEFLDKRRAQWK